MEEISLDDVFRLQNGLIARATGQQFDGGDDAYCKIRRQLLSNRRLSDLVPAIIRRCGDLDQFWAFIKYEHSTYLERRNLIWSEFRPLIDHLEAGERGVADETVTKSIREFGAAAIHADWEKALARRSSDPDTA